MAAATTERWRRRKAGLARRPGRPEALTLTQQLVAYAIWADDAASIDELADVYQVHPSTLRRYCWRLEEL